MTGPGGEGVPGWSSPPSGFSLLVHDHECKRFAPLCMLYAKSVPLCTECFNGSTASSTLRITQFRDRTAGRTRQPCLRALSPSSDVVHATTNFRSVVENLHVSVSWLRAHGPIIEHQANFFGLSWSTRSRALKLSDSDHCARIHYVVRLKGENNTDQRYAFYTVVHKRYVDKDIIRWW